MTTIHTLPTAPFRIKDKTNSAYCYATVTRIEGDNVIAHTIFADGYRKFERPIAIKDIELIPEHQCNPDSFNKHCQTCGKYCG